MRCSGARGRIDNISTYFARREMSQASQPVACGLLTVIISASGYFSPFVFNTGVFWNLDCTPFKLYGSA
ncbi:hypothetical protein P152DRAFT_70362 [Eremomyces bilateralis CBS 781.70]|uniref:Uncharacterized protein n=1 Tax=Eremomyces bilateralis CBS 781.70 TaxID=1392243 RepID=A0A6G1FZV8_9PEZI|nr:uncharacterized protein P152DRAFT_70362 [Eremomyces bilateralis CBS 781.70]KAF1811334.1 hypothetical protein P152DRAFT_70362 [Eremomyces bilateralis CBS 781.70]